MPDGSGSGWALTSDLIVTCRHVVVVNTSMLTPTGMFTIEWLTPTAEVETQDGLRFSAVVVGTSEQYDVAILRVTDNNLPGIMVSPLSLATDMPGWGQHVQVIAYPDGVGPRLMTGVVDGPYPHDTISVTTTVPSQAGASGGPLLTMDGAVCGMLHSGWRSSHRAICLSLDNLRRGIEECLHAPHDDSCTTR